MLFLSYAIVIFQWVHTSEDAYGWAERQYVGITSQPWFHFRPLMRPLSSCLETIKSYRCNHSSYCAAKSQLTCRGLCSQTPSVWSSGVWWPLPSAVEGWDTARGSGAWCHGCLHRSGSGPGSLFCWPERRVCWLNAKLTPLEPTWSISSQLDILKQQQKTNQFDAEK